MNIDTAVLIAAILLVLAIVASIGMSLYVMYKVGNKLDGSDE